MRCIFGQKSTITLANNLKFELISNDSNCGGMLGLPLQACGELYNTLQRDGTDNLDTCMSCLQKGLRPLVEHSIHNGGFLIHSAFIEHTKYKTGYLISARSGTGKTTCCSRIPHPWHSVCEDETLVVQTSPYKYSGHPFPTWSKKETSWDIQKHVPIKSIFFLEKSKRDEVVALRPAIAAYAMTDLAIEKCNMYWQGMKSEEVIEYKKMIFKNAWGIAQGVRTYLLRASLTGEFWKEIEKVV